MKTNLNQYNKLLKTFGVVAVSLMMMQSSAIAKDGTKIISSEPQVASEVPQFVAGAPISPSYAKAIGKMAYIWGWALVDMQSRHALFSKIPHKGLYGGALPAAPVGELTMLSDYMKPKQRFVTCPNQDVVYGAGFFSLDKEPVVLQVPDFKDRFWVYQVVNQRSDEYGKFGRQYNTEPGHYLLVGPNWKGEVPKGINKVYRSVTNISAIFPRVFMDNTNADRKAIQPLVNQVMAYPLSKYDGTMKTIVWKDMPTIEKKGGDSHETKWVDPNTFFDKLPSVLESVPPLPGEEGLYGMMKSVLDAAKNDPKVKEALVQAAIETEKDTIDGMFQFRNNGVDAGNGWRTQFNAAEFGFGYFQRTATAKGNMFSNKANETKYFGADFDSKGQRLDSKNNYIVTFAKGELPPVRGFWSLTMYNQQHFFVTSNDLGKYSVGTKNRDLVFNEDGSLTLYVQPTSPGKEKEANWLPAPKEGNFSIYIRAYWPDSKILRGEWIPPKIVVN